MGGSGDRGPVPGDDAEQFGAGGIDRRGGVEVADRQGEGVDQKFDEDLCARTPSPQAGRTVLLLDLTKPLSANTGFTDEVLRHVTTAMDADTELKVFALAQDPFAPRIPLGRICKPYADQQLIVEMAKDRASTVPDCADLPAQLPPKVRELATRFCARRDALARRIASVASRAPEATVPAAYLIEAIEDTRLELAAVTQRRSLYLFSDMMQHAAWYSHAEQGPDHWDYGEFQRVRRRQPGLVGASPPPDSDLDVTVFYIPRQGVTEHPRVALALERFWRGYFADVESVTFERQPLQMGYDVQPLRGAPADDSVDNPGDAPQPEPEPVESLVDARMAETSIAQLPPAAEAAVVHEGEVGPESGSATADTGTVERRPGFDPGADGRVAETVGEGMPQQTAEAVEESRSDGADGTGGDPPIAIPIDSGTGPDRPPIAALGTPGEPDQIPAGLAPPAGDTPLETPPCVARLRPEFVGGDLYPRMRYSQRRANYGSAEILVAYMIDDDGETVDDEVLFRPEQSRADVASHMSLFAESAVNAVRTWQFDFEVEQDGCEKSQRRATRFRFRYAR